MEKELSVGTRIDHPKYGEGIISQNNTLTYKIIFVRGGEIEFSKLNVQLDVLEEVEASEDQKSAGINIKEIEMMLKYVLDRFNGLEYKVDLGKKWQGGVMILQPANKDLKPKEIPIEAFFHKIVMMRDRLRVLEQNVNSHAILSDEEKISLQQYITRCYGTMTTFNILFDEKEDFFVGSKL
jgi:hypothetical protein